jgi:hypothetical protein
MFDFVRKKRMKGRGGNLVAGQPVERANSMAFVVFGMAAYYSCLAVCLLVAGAKRIMGMEMEREMKGN